MKFIKLKHTESRCQLEQEFHSNSGQALVTLLFFAIIAMIITAASVVLVLSNSQAANSISQSDSAYTVAESGAENAYLRLLRDQTYTGEVLTVDNGAATITVTGTNPYTITSVGSINNFQRTVVAVVTNTNNMLTVTSWKEVY